VQVPILRGRAAKRTIVWYKVRVMSEQHVASGAPQEEEPQTPIWLTALGAALFVGAALGWAVTPSAAQSTPAEPAASASAAAVAPSGGGAAAAPNPQAQGAHPAQPAAPPNASGQQARIPVPSALPAELQKRLNELRGKQHP
jgi:hypothetical protein